MKLSASSASPESPGPTVSFRDFAAACRNPDLRFLVSSRAVRPNIHMGIYLGVYYIYLDMKQISGVFGSTVSPSPLYGGRTYRESNSMNDAHVAELERRGIGLSLTLTNHLYSPDAYDATRPLLERHHQMGNTVVCVSDLLAARIKRDYPLYTLNASAIKNLHSPADVRAALDLYDHVTIPMNRMDANFLAGLPEKSRMILFGNGGCAYNCPRQSCYRGISQQNQDREFTHDCSRKTIPRPDLGTVYFDIQRFWEMGFSHFKLIPDPSRTPESVARRCSDRSRRPAPRRKIPEPTVAEPLGYLCSFPKCGRTWLRFIIANCLDMEHDLGLNVDLHSMFSLLPNDDGDSLTGRPAFSFHGDPRIPLVLASHAPYTPEKFGNRRVVLLLRSLYDAAVSDYFQRTHLLETFDGGLHEFIRSPDGGPAAYIDYLNRWAPHLDNDRTHIVTYEGLLADTAGTVADLLSFLGLPVTARHLQGAVERASFRNMRRLEKERGMAGFNYHFDTPGARRMREGRAGTHKTHLTPEDKEYIQKLHKTRLSPEAAALAAAVGIL